MQLTKINVRQVVRAGLCMLLLFVTFSCSNYLSELPDNRVEISSLENAQQLLAAGYSQGSYGFTEWMTDNVGYILGINLRANHQEAYAWQDFTDDANTTDTPAYYWSENYRAIAHANEVLDVLDQFPANTDQELALKDALRGEALLIRAYHHFMLVNIFANQYDPATAAADAGIPYVREPETILIKQYARNTVQEVYDLVEEDMLAGIDLVDDQFYIGSGKYHFTLNAALAFASRFYAWKADFNQSLLYSDRLLGDSPNAFIRDLTADRYQRLVSQYENYTQLYTSTEEAGNLLLMRKNSLLQRSDGGHGPTIDFFFDLYTQTNIFSEAEDVRTSPAAAKGINGVIPGRYQSLFERIDVNLGVGFPYHIFIAFSGEEVLFNRMEANLALNNLDEVLSDLNVLMGRRYDTGTGQRVFVTIEDLRFVFGTTGRPDLDDQVLAIMFDFERQKEFLWQGMRWFDVKRYGLEVEHALEDGGVILLNADDPRKIIQLPDVAIEVGGLEPNPR